VHLTSLKLLDAELHRLAHRPPFGEGVARLGLCRGRWTLRPLLGPRPSGLVSSTGWTWPTGRILRSYAVGALAW